MDIEERLLRLELAVAELQEVKRGKKMSAEDKILRLLRKSENSFGLTTREIIQKTKARRNTEKLYELLYNMETRKLLWRTVGEVSTTWGIVE